MVTCHGLCDRRLKYINPVRLNYDHVVVGCVIGGWAPFVTQLPHKQYGNGPMCKTIEPQVRAKPRPDPPAI
jgi:hypothetical protein